MNGVLISNVQHFLKSLFDENEGYQTGKVLLSESGYVADKSTGIKCNKEQHDDANPDSYA